MNNLLRLPLLALWLVLATPLAAQAPKITISAEQEEVVVGQAFILRVKVLVPSFMPEPPIFPSFELPGLIVRLPERATSPVSERVDGETWSGVQRSYRIYPTRAGEITLPAQEITLVFKDVARNEDQRVTETVPPLSFTATVPEAARGLDPLLIAQEVKITQDWQVADGPLQVGDAVVRRLTSTVKGTSPLFLPPLLTPAAQGADEVPAFRAYPEDPRISEKFDRGVISGERVEQVSYLAQQGGMAELPGITLRWFNLESGTVDEIALDGLSVEIIFPPAPPEPMAWGRVLLVAICLAVAALIAFGLWRWLAPKTRAQFARLHQVYAATGHAAHRQARQAARARDLTALLAALERRTARGLPLDAAETTALRALTRARYRAGSSENAATAAWRDVEVALRARHVPLGSAQIASRADALPALNDLGR